MIKIAGVAQEIRRQALEMSYMKKASHLGGAFSIIDVLSVLYFEFLNASKDSAVKMDRLFYSKGHACTALYSTLSYFGFIPKEDLKTFTDNGSIFTSHVSHKVPGIELSTGSLGHALPVAAGVAYARKLNKSNYKTVCILSDGELDEGSNWEAIMFAAHHKLNNLTIIVDYNKLQSFGRVEDVIALEPLADKFRAFNCTTIEIDGHNHASIKEALLSKNDKGPKLIIAHTVKGKGISFMENKLEWHYKSPNQAEYNLALKELGF